MTKDGGGVRVRPWRHATTNQLTLKRTQVVVFPVDKWIPFYDLEKWAFFAANERLAVMILTTVRPRCFSA